MRITLGDLMNDPALIEKLRLPKDRDREREENEFFEKLGDLVENNPIHSPGVRRG